MNIRSKKSAAAISMAILLWGIMMVLVLVTVAFMWVFQIHFMERNYIESNISMVSDILDYSQLQSGCLQLNTGPYDLCEIVESEVHRCEQSAQENHLTLSFEGPGEELNVQVDALKISQVVRNLLNNAINHTRDGETITVSVVKDRQGYLVRVVNPGDPIPEEDRTIIWERYQRSQHQAGRRQGTGIGLSIVKTILDAHSMTYGVDCQNGLTCFWFRYSAILS